MAMEVETKSLETHLDDRGYLYEALRVDDAIFEGELRQINVSRIYPDVVKAWHKHERQTDYVVCVQGNVKVGLSTGGKGDDRDVTTLCIGEDDPTLVKVPAGMWHGMTPIGNERATVVYAHDQTYDPDDEQRKSWDAFGDVWAAANR